MDKREMVNTFLSDPQNIFSFLKETGINARFAIDKMWENAKFFTTITSAIITVSVALMAMVVKDKPELFGNWAIVILVSCLPIVLIIISKIGIKNFDREYRRFLEWVVVTQKCYELLNFDDEIEFKAFHKDKFLLPERFVFGSHGSSKDFIEVNINQGGNLLYYFKWLHRCYIGIGFLLLVLMIFLWAGCSSPSCFPLRFG